MTTSQEEFDRQKARITVAVEVLNDMLNKAEKAGVAVRLHQHVHSGNTDLILLGDFSLCDPKP